MTGYCHTALVFRLDGQLEKLDGFFSAAAALAREGEGRRIVTPFYGRNGGLGFQGLAWCQATC